MSDVLNEPISITSYQLGTWRVKVSREPLLPSKGLFSQVRSTFPLFFLLLSDIYRVAPFALVVSILLQVLDGLDMAITTLISSQLLRTVEAGMATGRVDPQALLIRILYHVLQTVLVFCARTYQRSIAQTLQKRAARHFQIMLLQADFRKDPTTLQKTAGLEEQLTPTSQQALEALTHIFEFVGELCKSVSRVLLVWHISKKEGGPLFALVCACEPLYDMLSRQSLPRDVILGYVNNLDYLRMTSLRRFANDYKQDIVNNNVGNWVIAELKKTFERLGDIPTPQFPTLPRYYVNVSRQVVSHAFSSILQNLPLAYCALTSLRSGGSGTAVTSIASIAILQQLAQSAKEAIERTFDAFSSFMNSTQALQVIYSTNEESSAGCRLSYPPPLSYDYDPSQGMSLELRDVVFSYPSQQKVIPALNGVSLKILAGQVVIIVGENGCGKSTLVKLLSRQYEPTSGEYLIDGKPANQYVSQDLQKATTILSQDSGLYPLSLAENIGLGNFELAENEEMLLDAAKKGGALSVIKNFKDGLQTTLKNRTYIYASNIYNKPNHPLYKEMMDLRKDIDVSGGETQRIVAARAFFKFKSGQVRLVAVDEPSSALDAEAELELFNNLLAERRGKTLIMVTHRFGHLTKHADMIICMKDGEIAECGIHSDLIKREGQYAKLYSIQAGAFDD